MTVSFCLKLPFSLSAGFGPHKWQVIRTVSDPSGLECPAALQAEEKKSQLFRYIYPKGFDVRDDIVFEVFVQPGAQGTLFILHLPE